MSLRELLKDVALEDKAISQSAFRLMQGLVEAVEAIGVDKHMASLAYVHTELTEAQAEIEVLHKRRKKWAGEVSCLLECLSTRNVRIGELRKERDGWERGCWEAEQELAEAKAEIERLRKQRNDYRADLAEELRRRECLILAKVAACDAEEAMRADAEKWQLVLGMADRTRLIRGHPSNAACQLDMCYWAEKQGESTWLDASWHKVGKRYLKHDPAEALRAIQEVGDEA